MIPKAELEKAMSCTKEDMYGIPEHNEYGVEGFFGSKGVFIPKCCWNCQHFEDEFVEWYQETWYWCNKNVFFPVRKGTCKKREQW